MELIIKRPTYANGVYMVLQLIKKELMQESLMIYLGDLENIYVAQQKLKMKVTVVIQT